MKELLSEAFVEREGCGFGRAVCEGGGEIRGSVTKSATGSDGQATPLTA
jgi:hypothetical protein